MIYKLTKFKYGRHCGTEGRVLDYTIEREDGLALKFANDGNGGPCRLVSTSGAQACISEVLDDLKFFCAMEDPDRAEEIKHAAEPTVRVVNGVEHTDYPYGSRPELEDVSIWAEKQGEQLQFEKKLRRIAKRTVCWHMPGETGIGHCRLKRGQTITKEVRKLWAKMVADKYPGAIVHGGGRVMNTETRFVGVDCSFEVADVLSVHAPEDSAIHLALKTRKDILIVYRSSIDQAAVRAFLVAHGWLIGREQFEQRQKIMRAEDLCALVRSAKASSSFGLWKLGGDPSGALYWYHPGVEAYQVYATPGWEGHTGVAVDVSDEKGDSVGADFELEEFTVEEYMTKIGAILVKVEENRCVGCGEKLVDNDGKRIGFHEHFQATQCSPCQ